MSQDRAMDKLNALCSRHCYGNGSFIHVFPIKNLVYVYGMLHELLSEFYE